MNILLTAKLADSKLKAKIIPILGVKGVNKLFLVRKTPLHQKGITNINPPWFFSLPLLYELWRLVTMIFLAKRSRDLVIVGIQGFPHGLIATLVASLCSTACVIWLIGSDVRIRMHQPLLGGALRWMIRTADFIFVMGEPMQDEVRGLGVDSDRVGVMQLDLQQQIVCKPYSLRSYDILYVGNLIPLKRPDRVVNIVSYLKKRGLALRCLILGDGPEKASLSALVSQQELSDSITIAGFHSNPLDIMSEAKLLLLLSESEGLPTVIVEAAFCGLPVVCTDVGDTRAMLGDTAHVVFVPVNDEAQQRKVVESLLCDRKRLQELSEQATEFASHYQQEWSRSNLTALWEKSFRQIMNDITLK